MARRKQSPLASRLNGSLFEPELTWKAPLAPPRLEDVKVLALDTETHDPGLRELGPGFITRDSRVCGVSIAAEHEEWYFPLGHAGGNCNWDVKTWLQEELYRERKYVFANAQYDVEALWSLGATPNGEWVDVQLDQALIDEEFDGGYGLDNIAGYWLGVGKADEELMKIMMHYGAQDIEQAKTMMGYVSAGAVGRYAEVDARRTYDLYPIQDGALEADGLTEVAELERRIMPIVWQMRLRGIRFDRERAARLNEEWLVKERQMMADMMKMGFLVDPWSNKSLEKYCKAKGIAYDYTLKGNASFAKEYFEWTKDPLLKIVGQYRKLNKMRRDFIETWLVASAKTGNLHARWHQVSSDDGGTRSGRFASSDPNLQQVPVRDPYYGPIMRSLFLAWYGEKFMKGDYSGQEIRIAVHYANVLKCSGIEPIVRRYHEDPKFDFHGMVAEMAGIPRAPAKTLALGTLYGMQPRKSQEQLGFEPEEAEDVMRRYFEIAPYFKELAETATRRAEKLGYVKTFLGRRRRFKDGQNLHKAFNAVDQGTAADMVKKAMLDAFVELDAVPLLQVHDELCYSVPDDHRAEEIKHLMESALQLDVPMLVEMKLGEHW